MDNVLIRTNGLTKRFGSITVVDNLHIQVKKGEVYGFLGPNGAGKTTTIRMLTGLLEPSSGEAYICGYDINKEPAKAKALMAYVPDQPKLYGKLTAQEFLLLIADLYQIPRNISRKRSEQLLTMFGLIERGNELLEGYSHGMLQKVVLSSALIHQPQVILLDEPTVGLDPASARLIKDVLQKMAEMGAAILVSTHILEIAERMCNRVGILDNGKLIAEGSPAELRAQTGNANESLEDIFLELTNKSQISEIVKGVGEGDVW